MSRYRLLLLCLGLILSAVTASVASGGEDGAGNQSGTDTAAARLPGVVSINLCTDQLVLLLAHPRQILALSPLSLDAAGSLLFDQALEHRQVQPVAEDILPLAPDVVVTGPFTPRYTLSMLDELGLTVETLVIAESVKALLQNIRRIGRILQRQAQADSQVALLQSRLRALAERVDRLDADLSARGLQRPRAAVFDANGYTVGPASLRGELMHLSGWQNVAIERGVETYGVLSLEDMVRLAPDALIESPYREGSYSRGQMLTQHPALRQAGIAPQIISLPSQKTTCAGPWFIDLIESLVDARERWQRQ